MNRRAATRTTLLAVVCLAILIGCTATPVPPSGTPTASPSLAVTAATPGSSPAPTHPPTPRPTPRPTVQPTSTPAAQVCDLASLNPYVDLQGASDYPYPAYVGQPARPIDPNDAGDAVSGSTLTIRFTANVGTEDQPIDPTGVAVTLSLAGADPVTLPASVKGSSATVVLPVGDGRARLSVHVEFSALGCQGLFMDAPFLVHVWSKAAAAACPSTNEGDRQAVQAMDLRVRLGQATVSRVDAVSWDARFRADGEADQLGTSPYDPADPTLTVRAGQVLAIRAVDGAVSLDSVGVELYRRSAFVRANGSTYPTTPQGSVLRQWTIRPNASGRIRLKLPTPGRYGVILSPVWETGCFTGDAIGVVLVDVLPK